MCALQAPAPMTHPGQPGTGPSCEGPVGRPGVRSADLDGSTLRSPGRWLGGTARGCLPGGAGGGWRPAWSAGEVAIRSPRLGKHPPALPRAVDGTVPAWPGGPPMVSSGDSRLGDHTAPVVA